MNKVTLGARILLGLIYFVFGLNGFLQFIPAPADMPEGAMKFIGGLASAGYFFPFLKSTEIIGGLALLSGRFVALALVILAPITINIFLFHAILTPGLSNSLMPIFMVVLSILIALSEKEKYSALLKAK